MHENREWVEDGKELRDPRKVAPECLEEKPRRSRQVTLRSLGKTRESEAGAAQRAGGSVFNREICLKSGQILTSPPPPDIIRLLHLPPGKQEVWPLEKVNQSSRSGDTRHRSE